MLQEEWAVVVGTQRVEVEGGEKLLKCGNESSAAWEKACVAWQAYTFPSLWHVASSQLTEFMTWIAAVNCDCEVALMWFKFHENENYISPKIKREQRMGGTLLERRCW